ncbi:hypothetical protein GC194_01910 [bacterium]|nr:hypothetical protein [bacterium]
MNNFTSIAKRLAVLLLVIAVSIPCSLKRDVKEYLGIATSQYAEHSHAKPCCSTNNAIENKVQKKDQKKIYPKWVNASLSLIKNIDNLHQIRSNNTYDFIKEEVPTYIRCCCYLI